MTRTFNWRLVFKTMGVLTTIEALFMLVPSFCAWLYDDPDLEAWVTAMIITWLSSWWMLIAGRNAERRVGEREGYVIVATVWVVYSLFGMLPFWLSGAMPDITNAWFETTSVRTYRCVPCHCHQFGTFAYIYLTARRSKVHGYCCLRTFHIQDPKALRMCPGPT